MQTVQFDKKRQLTRLKKVRMFDECECKISLEELEKGFMNWSIFINNTHCYKKAERVSLLLFFAC